MTYWRALLRLDPDNAAASPRVGDDARRVPRERPRGQHIAPRRRVLRRLGLALEQRNAALAAVPPAPAVRPEDKARDEEMQRLRDELARRTRSWSASGAVSRRPRP